MEQQLVEHALNKLH